MRLGVTPKILIKIFVIMLVMFIVYGAITYERTKSTIFANMTETQVNAAESLANSINLYQSMGLRMTKAFADFASGQLDHPDRLVRGVYLLHDQGGYDTSYIGVEKDGMYINDSPDDAPTGIRMPSSGYDPRKRPWYKEAAAAGHGIITSIYISYDTKLPTFTLAAPHLQEWPATRRSG